jgi:HlyD family secretion protein
MALLPRDPLLVLLALSLAATLAGCSAPGSAKGADDGTADRAAKPIDTEPVRREAVNRTVNVSGTLAAENQVTVSSQAEGAVSRILADLGDRVVSGQVLV